MKFSGIPLIATITLAAILTTVVVLNSNNSTKIETFGERLRSLAKEVNSARTTWKAYSDSRFINLTREQALRKLGTILEMGGNDPSSSIEHIESIPYP